MSTSNIISTKSLRPRSSGFSHFCVLLLAVLAPIIFLFSQNLYAADVTLAWDANSEEDLAGYRIFYREEGQNYDYNVPGWEGSDTTCTISNLNDITTYYFVARAFDTSGTESGNSDEVCYLPNKAPTADAGTDQTVNEGVTVTLNGSNSTDPDGTITTYQWSQTAGIPVTFSDATSVMPSFTAPDVDADGETLIFLLTVTDNGGLQATDSCIVNVSWVNIAPTADAGADQAVNEGVTVTLNGSNSTDPDGTITTYQWSQTAGIPVTFSDATSVMPSFTAPDVDADGETLTFLLTVTDNGGLQATDTCIVNVSWINIAPTADAGADQTVNEGVTVTLNGSNSTDPDGTITTYQWSQTAGIPVTLSDATSVMPSFTAPDVDADGETLTFLLTVTDNGGLQATDSCIVNVSWVYEPPTLNSVSISGASSVNENSTSIYTVTATFSGWTTETLTESVTWSEDSSFATMNSIGVLSTSEVMSDETVTITASYTYGDVTKTAEQAVTITDIPQSNLPPRRPRVISPYYGQTECELLTNITTEPFSDPDGDFHSQSRWHISKKEDFSSLMLDVNSTEHLTKLPVPHTVLETGSTYYVRVQFCDAYSETSEWSDPVEFTTTTSDFNDVDADGIPDDQEVGDNVDLNGDGIADNDQPEVIKCIHSSVDNVTIGLCKLSDSINAIDALETIDPSTIIDKIMRPQKFLLGLFSYRLSVNEPGAKAIVRVYFSEGISKAREFYKYDTIRGWQDWTEHTIFNDDGRSITLEVVDGGFGDSDAVANGVIVDPGALFEETEVVETDENIGLSGDGGGGGCFISTAAFGSYAEPHVKLLRDFREWFIRMYHRCSPFWTDLINIHTGSKPIVRLSLMPLVGISYVLIKATLFTKILYGLLPAIFLLGCFLRMRGKSVAGNDQM